MGKGGSKCQEACALPTGGKCRDQICNGSEFHEGHSDVAVGMRRGAGEPPGLPFMDVAPAPAQSELEAKQGRLSVNRRLAIEQALAEGVAPSPILTPLDLGVDTHAFDLNFYDGGGLTPEKLQEYYALCRDAGLLIVTTSCFSAWKQNKKTNGSAKVIPAIPAGGSNRARVFFFDDNINLSLGGQSNMDGICNLRDINTGEFVDFSEGVNGFVQEQCFKFTVIHTSTEYNNVLVQANILDAMGNVDYFKSIILQYAKPEEKLIVFMDVNGTIAWEDTISNKNMSSTLLSTLFRFVEVSPRKAFDFKWMSQPAVRVEKRTQILRILVRSVCGENYDIEFSFWNYDCCRKFLSMMMNSADLHWVGKKAKIKEEDFFEVYEDYLAMIQRNATNDGVSRSWHEVYKFLAGGHHATVLNSFGVDSRRVVMRTMLDRPTVLQIAVNYNMWFPRDVNAWIAQFCATA